jgi:hypothetical protein
VTPTPTPVLPGTPTVPPWEGWQWLLTGALVAALAAAVLVAFLAVGRSAGTRPEWRDWLAARSAARREAEDRARAVADHGV